MKKPLVLGAYNIQCGGYPSYESPVDGLPERLDRAATVVRDIGAEAVVLSDTFGWHKPNGELRPFAEDTFAELGFVHTHGTLLDDPRLNRDRGREIGVAIVSKYPLGSKDVVRLSNRNALIAKIHGMKVVGCYFDDLSEDVRLKQAEAVLGYDPDAIAGDLNATHGKEKLSASMRAFCTEAILRTTALSPVQPDILRCIQGMREGRVLSLLKREGFVDADSMRRPTSPLLSRAVPFLQLDHVMAQSRTLEVLSFWSEGTAEDADHKAIATSLRKRAA